MKSVLASIVVSIFSLSAAKACDCAQGLDPATDIENTALVALVTIVDARLLSDSEVVELVAKKQSWLPSAIAIATVEIDRPVKGAAEGESIQVYFDVEGTDCSLSPIVGSSDIYFIDMSDGDYWIYFCHQDRFRMKLFHDQYIDEIERLTGEDWGVWRYDR